MKFSVIVPVYNVEEYLQQCLDSILSQDYSDYEIILVNDGSTDRSSFICEENAKKYGNIHYYSKQNEGLSGTRNFGIEHSQGDYCVFVDSDDWIKEGSLKKIAETINDTNPDVIVTKLIEVYPDYIKDKDKDFAHYISGGFDKKRAIQWNFNTSKNPWPAQKTIVSRKLIKNFKLTFLQGRVHEDLDWTTHLYLKAESFAAFSEEWYFHRLKREGSITSIQKAKNYIDTIEIAGDIFDELNKSEDENEKAVLQQVMRSVYGKLNQIKKCDKSDIKKVAESLRKNKRILSLAPSPKYKAFTLANTVFGSDIALKMLQLF